MVSTTPARVTDVTWWYHVFGTGGAPMRKKLWTVLALATSILA